MYNKRCLDNDLRIVTHTMPQRRSLSLGIWIKTGGRYETDKLRGISHFLEHILFKGTRNFSCRKIKESVEGVGGVLNGFTSEELTCYLVKIPSRYMEVALDILSDMVIHPLLPAEEIEKERFVILEEIKMYKDLPQSYIYELLNDLMWPGEPLGASVIGSEETVRGLTKNDLKNYKNRSYTPANIVVSAAGFLEEDTFFKKVGKKFSSLKKSAKNRCSPAIQRQHTPRLKVFYKETEQTHLALGFHGFKRGHPLKYAQDLLHILLGANMSSRLFNEIREKRGLAYEIGTHSKCYSDTGAFIVHAGIDNRKVEETVVLILRELQKIKDNPPGKAEFKRAKDYYIGQLILSLEDTLDNMFLIGESTISLDKVLSAEQIIDKIERITLEDVFKVSQSIFRRDKINCAFIGPINDKNEKLHSLLNLK